MYLKFPGELLTRMLQEAVLPLMTSSVIATMGSMDLPLAVRVGRRALVYGLLTKLMAQGVSVLVALFMQPGHSVELAATGDQKELLDPTRNGTVDMLYDLMR
ncbi:neutral amino acid transporter A-like [Ixodes scapularis]|uniref:neutral amino acid transporter A-like n=1 Tax=Ixodes scapularis TaxID=6945 RepID=UPI001A9F72E4|nr:neutral amino acid transporter A-like [Ixodes scapularis]